MKITFRTSAAFILSGGLGFFVAYLLIPQTSEPDPVVSNPSYSESEALDSLKKQNALLEATILKLKEENTKLQEHCEELENTETSDEDRTTSTQSLKNQWIQEIIDQPDPNTVQRFQSEMIELQRRYHLTTDQMLQLEPLLRQREQFSKTIMLRHLGLISEEEFRTRFATLGEFNFDQAVTNLLSEEQKQRYLESRDTQQNIGLNVAAYSFAEQYRITDPERFTPEQQSSIQGLFKKALESAQDLEILPSIQELDIDIMEKRMLSIGYKELDEETFQKMYQAIIDRHENK